VNQSVKAWVEDKVDEVIAKKSKVEKANETKQNAEYKPTFDTCVNIIKNKHAEEFDVRSKSKKIAVKVFIVRAKTEEIDVKKQNAGNADTHHPPEHLQERLNQGVHRARPIRADQRAPADRQ
jgi:hypothetical protein